MDRLRSDCRFHRQQITTKTGEGLLVDTLPIVGAVVGGWLFAALGRPVIIGFDRYSMLVAVMGAARVLLLERALFRR